MRDEISKFESNNVQPLGVNPATAEQHANYVRKLNLPFPLLSDPERAIARAYLALKPDGSGIQRTVYAIRDDGTIALGMRGSPAADDVVAPFRP